MIKSAIALFIVLIISLGVFSQSIELVGMIVDSLKNPISFATVEIRKPNNGVGIAANQEGIFNFSIPPKFANDTILISALGYNSKKILLSEIDTKVYSYIVLQPRQYELSEVIVKPEVINEVELGITQTSRYSGGILTRNLTQIAVYVENPFEEHGILKNISFFCFKKR